MPFGVARAAVAPGGMAARGAALASPLAAAERGQTLVIHGAGSGHGVGLSQQGALGLARHGQDYRAILAHYYAGTRLGAASPGQRATVLLQGNVRDVVVSAVGAVGRRRLRPGAAYQVASDAGGIAVLRSGRRALARGPRLLIRGHGGFVLRGRAENGVTDGRYRGALEVRAAAHGGGLDAINVIAVEEYVRGVVANEVPAEWPAAVLQAQAVASRSYAITATDGPKGVFALYANTRSQLYRGVAGETARTDAAVRATAGRVVTYAGRPAFTNYFDSSGGATENVENVWPGAAPSPWLRGVPDPYDAGPQHRWTVRLSFGAAASRLGGLVRGTLRGIEVRRRGYSPRIVSAAVMGSQGTVPVGGGDLARRLGLASTWASFAVDDGHGEHPLPDLSGGPPGAGIGAPAPLQGSPSGGTQAG